MTWFRRWHRAAVMLSTLVGAATAADAAQRGATPMLVDRAPQTASNPEEDPGRYWNEERMRDAQPFPMPQASDQDNDRSGPIPDGEPIESAPAAPPVLPRQ